MQHASLIELEKDHIGRVGSPWHYVNASRRRNVLLLIADGLAEPRFFWAGQSLMAIPPLNPCVLAGLVAETFTPTRSSLLVCVKVLCHRGAHVTCRHLALLHKSIPIL